MKSYTRGSNIAKHAWSLDHSFDLKNSQVIDEGSSYIRKTLESWYTASIDHADNNSRPLPYQYSILLKKNNSHTPLGAMPSRTTQPDLY